MQPIIFEPGQRWVLKSGARWSIVGVAEDHPEQQNENHAAVNGTLELREEVRGAIRTVLVSPSWARATLRHTGAFLVALEV